MSAGRKYLTAREKAEILFAQGGKCAKPNCGSKGPFDWDHSTPNAWKPGKPDQALCRPCHKAKTAKDIGKIAKVDRIVGETHSQWMGTNTRRGRIPSRPFDKSRPPNWPKQKMQSRKFRSHP